MKKEWFVSYQIPNEKIAFVGPVKGSRKTARDIKKVLKKANPELTNVRVVESQAPGSFSTDPKDFMILTESQLKQAIHALGTVKEDNAGIIRKQMRNIQQLHQEAEAILRSLWFKNEKGSDKLKLVELRKTFWRGGPNPSRSHVYKTN